MNRLNSLRRQIPRLGSFGALLGVLLVGPLGVLAQNSGAELSSLRISLWPEYDQPAILVIYDATLDSVVALPQTLRVAIPNDATVNAVAFPGETGGLFSLAWTSEPGTNGQILTFEVNSPQFVVEYYLDTLSPPPDRSFDVSLIVPYNTEQTSLLLRQPSGASNLETTPELAPAGTDALGNPQYSETLGPVAAGQVIDLSVSYTKADEMPSVSGSALVPPGSEVTVDGATPAWLPWLIGGLLLGLLVVVAVVLVRWLGERQARQGTRQARRKREREKGYPPNPGPSVKEPVAGGQNKFCPRCGRHYDPGDRFCRDCGTLRQ